MQEPSVTCRALSSTSFSLSVTGLYITNTTDFSQSADGTWRIYVGFNTNQSSMLLVDKYASTTYSTTVSLPNSAKVEDVKLIELDWTVNGTKHNWSKGYMKYVSMTYQPPPTVPSSISYSSSINSYYTTSISWGTSTVEGGGSITYVLERSKNSGSFSQVYSGSGTSYTDSGLSSSDSKVQYRVKAVSGSASSGYKTGSVSSVYYSKPVTVSTPGSISYPSSINAANSVSVSWGTATASNGAAVTYYLERATNGGSYTQIYSGAATSYSDSGLTSSTTSVTYRVRAKAGSTNGSYRTGTASSVYYNVAPTTPASINVPSSIRGGKSVSISWGTSSDSNLSGYVLQRSVNGGSFTQLYKGSSRSYTDTAGTDWSTVQYRVYAYDTYSVNSGYRTSDKVTVVQNTEPTISGSNGSLGGKTGAFSVSYTVTDPDSDQTITVVEKIDSNQKRSYTATSGNSYTFNVTASEWTALLNGSHTLTITATDNLGGSATRTYTFTKNETEIQLQLASPLAADDRMVRGIMSITRGIPEGAAFTVEVCNNGNDTTPTWEDVTNAILNNQKFFFSNQTKTASSWGFNFRIKVQRNAATGDCYIQGIGGNFE